jgi:hypothetical protein
MGKERFSRCTSRLTALLRNRLGVRFMFNNIGNQGFGSDPLALLAREMVSSGLGGGFPPVQKMGLRTSKLWGETR